MKTENHTALIPRLEEYMVQVSANTSEIPPSRREKLDEMATYISQKAGEGSTVKLIFICTHNSRRSHMAHLWAEACARRAGMSDKVQCYSGGTEATAFYPQAVKAMGDAGWQIEKTTGHPEMEAVSMANPGYLMTFSGSAEGKENSAGTVLCFSKHFAETPNPKKDFAAVMVCSDADDACPFVPGAAARFSLPYDDPKAFDARPEAAEKYAERCAEIACEMDHLFRRAAELM